MTESASSSQGTSTAATTWPAYESLKLTFVSPKLNKKNYVDWAPKAKIVLAIQRVWGVVSGEEKEPTDAATAETRNDWNQRNLIALAILGGSIEESEYKSIRNMDKAHEAWSQLRDVHRPEGDQAFYRLLVEVMKVKMDTSVQ